MCIGQGGCSQGESGTDGGRGTGGGMGLGAPLAYCTTVRFLHARQHQITLSFKRAQVDCIHACVRLGAGMCMQTVQFVAVWSLPDSCQRDICFQARAFAVCVQAKADMTRGRRKLVVTWAVAVPWELVRLLSHLGDHISRHVCLLIPVTKLTIVLSLGFTRLEQPGVSAKICHRPPLLCVAHICQRRAVN